MKWRSTFGDMGILPSFRWRSFHLLFLAVIFLPSVFSFYVETPEELERQAQEADAFHKKVAQRYDVESLKKFLEDQISENLSVDGVSLRDSRIGDKWVRSGLILTCGDWYAVIEDPEKDLFSISWNYEIVDSQVASFLQKTVTFDCYRISKSQFSILRLYRHEDHMFELNP